MINSGYVPGKINNGLKEADKNKYVLCKNPFNDNIIVCVNVDICCIDNIFHMKSAWILTDFDIIKILSNEILSVEKTKKSFPVKDVMSFVLGRLSLCWKLKIV